MLIVFGALLVGIVSVANAQTTLRVKSGATPGGDGSTWGTAYDDLQAALAAAAAGSGPYEIWVAEGTYKPTTGADRAATFQLLDEVALYGGFDGTETLRGQRNWEDHETILSGDLDGDDGPEFDNRGDNSYHVVTGSGTDDTAVLDGFTVTGGDADGDGLSEHSNSGGGMYINEGHLTLSNCRVLDNRAAQWGGGIYNISVSSTVTNCIFSGNSAWDGGGMYNKDNQPVVTDCTFSGNSAAYRGGGMANIYSSPTVINCTFSGNSGGVYGGGGMQNFVSSATVINCTFSGNEADGGGGGMLNSTLDSGGMGSSGSSPTVTNCTFSGNSALGDGGGMGNWGSSPTVTNCAFSGNSTDWVGGGMSNITGSSPTVSGCTFSGNSAADQGGGIANYNESSPTVIQCTFFGNSWDAIHNSTSSPTMMNTVLAGNTPDDCAGDVGSLISGGYNLESGTSCGCTQPTDQQNADPLLGPLADNGGPTLTHALLPCSPAIDAIPAPYNGAPSADQRGFLRPYPANGLADIGAVEMQFAYPPGDVNGDLAIDLLDVVLCRQIASGLVRGTACRRAAADVDDDGDVDADDVTILSEYVLGIRTTLP
ncbi:choice-of-anchor Q domain-containing protein [Candidatus Bipolaricaulota bacterium]